MVKAALVGQANLSWQSVYEASLVLNDAFRQDFIRGEHWPAEYDLSALTETDHAALLRRSRAFRVATGHFARYIYLNLRRDPRFFLLVFRDGDGDGDGDGAQQPRRPVGMATVILPQYFVVARPSWLYRFKTWLLSVWFWVQDVWEFRSLRNPLHTPQLAAEFQLGAAKCGALPDAAREQRLRGLSRDERAKESYPKPWAYYLNFFAVSFGVQGQGLGKLMLDTVLDTLRTQFGIVDPPWGGPAKLELFSSPAARAFYARRGFTRAAHYHSRQPSGADLDHSFFFLNLN